MKTISLSKYLFIGVIFFSLFNCDGDKTGSRHINAQDKIIRENTLYMVGFQWGPPNTFNPLAFSWRVAFPLNAQHNLMYEPLMVFNTLSGELEPLLAHSPRRSNDVIPKSA